MLSVSNDLQNSRNTKKKKKRNYELHSRYRHVFVSRTKLKKIKRIIIKVSLLIKNFAIEIIQRSIKRISENDRKEKKKKQKRKLEITWGRGGGEGGRGRRRRVKVQGQTLVRTGYCQLTWPIRCRAAHQPLFIACNCEKQLHRASMRLAPPYLRFNFVLRSSIALFCAFLLKEKKKNYPDRSATRNPCAVLRPIYTYEIRSGKKRQRFRF